MIRKCVRLLRFLSSTQIRTELYETAFGPPGGTTKYVVLFGTREESTGPARQNFTANRPRRRCLSDEHGLVALGLAARAKRRCLNLFNDMRACGTVRQYARLRHGSTT